MSESILLKSGLTFQAPEFIDHQCSGTFGECERMCYYSLGLGRRRKELTTALDWGSTFHGCIDILKTVPDLDEAMARVNAFIEGHLFDDAEDRYGRTKERMYEVLVKWVQWRASNPIGVMRNEQPTIVTCNRPCLYFSDEEGCNLTYGGIMDEIVEWQGYTGPLDYKTTVMTDKDAANEFRLSHQLMGYVWIASHLLGNHCWGGLIERVITNKSKIEFGRYPISYSRHNIQEWVQNERVLQADFRHKAANYPDNETAWRQNRGRCWEPYPCQFRDVCIMPQGMFRDKWLLNNTREERWNFMERDKAGNK